MLEINREDLVGAVRNSFAATAGDDYELHVVGNTVIEFFTALGMTDGEIINVLEDVYGYCSDTDDYIEGIIDSLK